MASRHRKAVRVSHIGASENLDSDTQIGTIIINFLVASKIDPNANVALVVDTTTGRMLKSLYDFDLYDPVSILPGSPDLILTSVNFENNIDKKEGLLMLIEYLEGVSNKSYDDNNIYEKALVELERVPVIQERVVKTVLIGQKSGYVPEEEEEIITQRRVALRQVYDNDPSKFTPSDTVRMSPTYGITRMSPPNGILRMSPPNGVRYTNSLGRTRFEDVDEVIYQRTPDVRTGSIRQNGY